MDVLFDVKYFAQNKAFIIRKQLDEFVGRVRQVTGHPQEIKAKVQENKAWVDACERLKSIMKSEKTWFVEQKKGIDSIENKIHELEKQLNALKHEKQLISDLVLQKGKVYLKESQPKLEQLENELLETEAVFGSLRALLSS